MPGARAENYPRPTYLAILTGYVGQFLQTGKAGSFFKPPAALFPSKTGCPVLQP